MNAPLTRIPITFPGPLVALLGDPRQLDATVGLSFCGDDLYIRTRSGSRMAGHTGTIAWSRVLHSPSLAPWMVRFDLYPDESTGVAPDAVLLDVQEGTAFVGDREQVERALNGPVAQPVEPVELDEAALEEINQQLREASEAWSRHIQTHPQELVASMHAEADHYAAAMAWLAAMESGSL